MAAEQRIILPYAPCIVAHRRCGKTVACINDMIKRAIILDRPHGRYAYVAPGLS
jgi:hypothetical protein